MKFDAEDPRTWPSYECRNEVDGHELGEKAVCGFVFRLATDIDVPSLSCPWCEEAVERTSPSQKEAVARSRIAALKGQRDAIDEEITALEEEIGG